MDLDGFVKLSDAQRANATAQASIASTLADIPEKLAKADLTEQQAINQLLKNVKLDQENIWDAQAHDRLQRMIKKALQDQERIIKERARLTLAVLHVHGLLTSGGSWGSVRDGWLAFAYLCDHAPLAAMIKAADVVPDASAYSESSWGHPTHALPPMPEKKTPGDLIQWASKHTCFPKWGSMAYSYIGSFLQALSDAAALEATAIQTRLEAAKASALALEQRDWDRLKDNATKG